MKNKFYITTPIYYINDIPHIGHAYTSIAADVLARYHKSLGEDVFFMTGTDEHGAKIAEAAEKKSKEPKEFVDDLVPKFKKAWEKLNIDYDQFFRTTNEEHKKIVQEIVSKLKDKGFIEKKKYEGLYCVACEQFYMPDELAGGKLCPIHKREVTKHKEENHFFLLSKLSDKLLEAIENDRVKIRPMTRKNEIVSKIKNGLEDVSISRAAVSWGIEFPGDPEHTVYVWVDALLNYYSATKIYKDGPEWPADIHLLAKDILWFHGIIWPAILIALEMELPKLIFAHGFFTIGGEKMSKSLGNVLDPIPLTEKYGTDAVRYALLREFPFGEDGDISEEKIARRYQSDLGNELGNLLQRTLSMINKYGVKIESEKLILVGDGTLIKNLQFEAYLVGLWKEIKEANAYIDSNKPWELARTDKEKLTKVLSYVYNKLLSVAKAIEPFMPETAEKMKKQLEALKPEPLFPRIEEKSE